MTAARSLSFRLRRLWRFLLAVSLAFGCSEAMLRLGWLDPLENVYHDYWRQYAGKRRDAAHAAVVAVDEQTLDQYKDDPLAFWQPHFARDGGAYARGRCGPGCSWRSRRRISSAG